MDIGNKREEWMTELPSAQAANLGLGPRKFKLRDGPDMSDRSCWTDTPAQKARKQMDLVNIRNMLLYYLCILSSITNVRYSIYVTMKVLEFYACIVEFHLSKFVY